MRPRMDSLRTRIGCEIVVWGILEPGGVNDESDGVSGGKGSIFSRKERINDRPVKRATIVDKPKRWIGECGESSG